LPEGPLAREFYHGRQALVVLRIVLAVQQPSEVGKNISD
jgi:hypothetical protein